MAEYKVYHNSRCSKSRMAVQYLEEQGNEFEVVEYLKELPSFDELQEVLALLGIKAHELIRKNEADYKKNFKGKDLSETEWIQAMLDYPKLIERPIVIRKGRAVVARPTERIDELK